MLKARGGPLGIMAAMNDWYLDSFAARIPWHANFNANAQATGTTYGLSAADKTDILNDTENVAIVANFKESINPYRQAVTEWAEITLEGAIGDPARATGRSCCKAYADNQRVGPVSGVESVVTTP